EKLFTDTLIKTMVEPRRQCFSFSAFDLSSPTNSGSLTSKSNQTLDYCSHASSATISLHINLRKKTTMEFGN
ncbi:hypothetical protein PIB30_099609, partial [Stylosanthes scabra]|nr:hypothetical protein [Stylosanthes scabra]